MINDSNIYSIYSFYWIFYNSYAIQLSESKQKESFYWSKKMINP